MSEENKNKGSWGCFIFVFILIAAGIPAATKGEGPIGTIVVVIFGFTSDGKRGRCRSTYRT